MFARQKKSAALAGLLTSSSLCLNFSLSLLSLSSLAPPLPPASYHRPTQRAAWAFPAHFPSPPSWPALPTRPRPALQPSTRPPGRPAARHYGTAGPWPGRRGHRAAPCSCCYKQVRLGRLRETRTGKRRCRKRREEKRKLEEEDEPGERERAESLSFPFFFSVFSLPTLDPVPTIL